MAAADSVAIPRWFVSFLSVLVSVVCVAAATWAYSVSTNLAGIEIEVKGFNELKQAEFVDVRRRLDRLEVSVDRIGDRLK